MKRLAVMIAVFVLILTLAGSAAAYTYTSYEMSADRTSLIRNADGVYLIGYGGKEVRIERLAPCPIGATLSLRYAADEVGVFDDTLVVLCGDQANHQLVVYTYDIDADYLDSFAVSGIESSGGFWYDGAGIWMIDEDNGSVMNRYSRSGALLCSYTFPNRIGYVVDGDGCGYAVCSGMLYRLVGDSVTAISGSRVNTPLCCIVGEIFSDAFGRIYELNGDRLSLLYTLESGYECASACLLDGYLYYPVDNTIYRYEAESGVKRGWMRVDGTVAALFCADGEICAVTRGGALISRIHPSEFTVIRPTQITDNADGVPRSEIYRVDYDTYRITGLSSPTTFAQFKARMNYDGYTAKLYRGEKEVKSGNVGTAMQVVFSNGRRSYTFELGVTGDLTGEGNVNSRDIGELMGYLLETVTFDGVYLSAADLSDDGWIDVTDLALLAMTVG